MANVATAAQADRLLALLEERWTEVAQVATVIDQWDLLNQLRYTETWPLERECLAQLEQLRMAGEFTDTQEARYQGLKALIARHEPLLQRMLKG